MLKAFKDSGNSSSRLLHFLTPSSQTQVTLLAIFPLMVYCWLEAEKERKRLTIKHAFGMLPSHPLEGQLPADEQMLLTM